MRRMLCLGAVVLVGGAACAFWCVTGRVEIEIEVGSAKETAAFTSPVLTPQFVAATPTPIEADEPIVVERPDAPAFTSLPEFDAAPGVVQSHGEAQPPRAGETTVPRMPEVVD